MIAAHVSAAVEQELCEDELAKHSKAEREKRKEQHEAVARIEAAWQASVPAAKAKEFAAAVAAARARGPDCLLYTTPSPPDD